MARSRRDSLARSRRDSWARSRRDSLGGGGATPESAAGSQQSASDCSQACALFAAHVKRHQSPRDIARSERTQYWSSFGLERLTSHRVSERSASVASEPRGVKNGSGAPSTGVPCNVRNTSSYSPH